MRDTDKQVNKHLTSKCQVVMSLGKKPNQQAESSDGEAFEGRSEGAF